MASSFSVGLGKMSDWWQRFTAYVRDVFSPGRSSGHSFESGGPDTGTEDKVKAGKRALSKANYVLWGSGLLLFAVVFSSWLWWQDRDYRALYGRHEAYDTAAVIESLEHEDIAYRLHPESGQILVHSGDISSARMALAQAGIVIPVRSQLSRSDRGSSLGTSHFTERARYIQNLEEELSRTIQGIDAVRLARVHLAVPEQSSFLRETPGSRASVSLDIYQGQVVSRSMIRGIIELVAGSVAGLGSEAVAVVDQSGKLLSAEVSHVDEGTSATSQQLAVRSQIEMRLENQVAKLVEAVSGPGKYRVDVAVDMDFSNQESAWEDFGPEKGVLRSESVNASENPSSSDVAEITGGSDVRSGLEGPLVRNYEVNRQVNKVVRVPGRLLYLSVAVLLDYRTVDDGTSTPWSEAELMSLQSLVEQAVGARDDRSDRVTVQSMPFFQPVEGRSSLSLPLSGPSESDRFYLIAGGVIALLLALSAVVVRARSRRKAARLKALAAARARVDASDESGLERGERAPVALSDEQLEERKRVLMAYASSNPDRVAMVLKKWMQSEE